MLIITLDTLDWRRYNEEKTGKLACKVKAKTLEKGVLKRTFHMAWPAVIESLFAALTSFVDTLMVSSLGSDAVAAVGLTAQPRLMGLALFLALGVASSAVIARRYGEGRRDNANTTLLTAIFFSVAASVVVTLLFVFGADGIIRFCGSSDNTHTMAVQYLKIVMGGIFFQCMQLVINASQRGAGNTRITMITNLISNSLNVIFNYLLIGGRLGFPALGVRGAAIATVLGSAVSFVISVVSLFRKGQFLNIPYIIKEKIRPSWEAFRVLCRFGYSIFAEQLLLRIGMSATAIMAAKTGDNSMAAHQVAMNVMTISFAFGDGLQSAAVALIGRSLGEKKPEQAKAYGRACQTFGLVISLVLAVLYFLLADWIMELFFPGQAHIVEIGRHIMWMIILIVLVQIRQVIYMGCLRGAGDTLFTAIVAIVSVTILRTVVSYVFGFSLNWGIIGVWMGILADQVGRFALSYFRFRSGKWTKIRV